MRVDSAVARPTSPSKELPLITARRFRVELRHGALAVHAPRSITIHHRRSVSIIFVDLYLTQSPIVEVLILPVCKMPVTQFNVKEKYKYQNGFSSYHE